MEKIKDRTFFLVKPDGVPYLTEINYLLKNANISAVYSNLIKPKSDQILAHYKKNDEWLIKYGRKIIAARFGLGDASKIDKWDALHYGNTIIPAIAKYMTSGEMVASILESADPEYAGNIYDDVRSLLGNIEPREANPYTIRYLGHKKPYDTFLEAWLDINGPKAIRNIAHASDDKQASYQEACIFLGKDVANKYFDH